MPLLDELPRTASYLAALPDGLDAYPECQAKGSMARAVLDYKPDRLEVADLPEELRWMLEHPPTSNQWIPETRVLALMHAVRDLAFDSDEAYVEWVAASLYDLFATPMYRLLMAMASPQLLARQAERAWARVRRGTVRELEELGANRNVGLLRYPNNLFDPLSMEIVRAGIAATYRLSRARAPEVRVIEWTPTYSRLLVVYDVSAEKSGEQSGEKSRETSGEQSSEQPAEDAATGTDDAGT